MPPAKSDPIKKIEAFCFPCRARVTYIRSATLLSRPMYNCATCGHLREIQELGTTVVPYVPEPGPKKYRSYMKKPKVAPASNQLKSALESIIDARLAGIREEVNAALDEILGGRKSMLMGTTSNGRKRVIFPPGWTCPRGIHKGFHGKKCLAASDPD